MGSAGSSFAFVVMKSTVSRDDSRQQELEKSQYVGAVYKKGVESRERARAMLK
jgi:hypothetical protein